MSINIKQKLFLFMILITFFKPGYIANSMPSISKLYNVLFLISCGIIMLLVLKNRNVSKISVSIIIYKMVLIFITWFNGGDIKNTIFNSLYIVFLSLLIDIYIHIDAKGFLKTLLLVLEILIYINFVTVLLYPNGMYETRFTENFFLGYDNVVTIYMFPALCISIVCSYMSGDKLSKRTIVLIIVAILTFVIRWTATNLIVIFLIIAFLMLPELVKNSRIFNILNYIIIYIISFFSIIVYRVQDLFEYLIVNVLNKSLTFTGRVAIWDRNMEYIKSSPIIGYGMEDETYRTLKNNGFSHAHNQILEILYQGGILLLISYIYIIYIVSKQLLKCKDNKIAKIISFFIFMLFIIMLMEVFRIDYLWIIFILGYNVKAIIEESEKDKEE